MVLTLLVQGLQRRLASIKVIFEDLFLLESLVLAVISIEKHILAIHRTYRDQVTLLRVGLSVWNNTLNSCSCDYTTCYTSQISVIIQNICLRKTPCEAGEIELTNALSAFHSISLTQQADCHGERANIRPCLSN